MEIALGKMAKIALGKMAEEKASTSEIRAYADELVQDHTSISIRW
jgi:hypothetical protein